MDLERALGDTEIHSIRHRGNDWHFIKGRKEKEGRAPLTGDEAVSHRKKSVKTQLVQDEFRVGPRVRVAPRLTLVRAGSKVKVIKTKGDYIDGNTIFRKGYCSL